MSRSGTRKSGRKPKPSGLKVGDGGVGRERPDIEPTGGPIPHEAPAHLPEVARDWWKDKAPVVNRTGVATASDLEAFEHCAVMYGRARECDEILKEVGLTFVHPATGVRTKHPEVSESRACWKEFRIGCETFGLTPSGRARTPPRLPSDRGDQAEDEFIFGRRGA